MVNDRLQPRSNWSSAGRIAILSSVLFLSGIGSLIFETLWLRLSGLTFGNSIWSVALILSSFMAGMALGNGLAASLCLQRWRALQLYAFLEVVIAFLGCTIVFGLPLLGEWLRPVFQTLWNYQSILLGLRFVLSFLVLLLPATAMGLTLPVLMEDSFLQSAEFGRAIGILYGVNRRGNIHCRVHSLAGGEKRRHGSACRESSGPVASKHYLSTTLAFTFCQFCYRWNSRLS